MQTVLFVCVHNSNRSQMAEAFFNSLAAERGVKAHAESAGTQGAGGLGVLAAKAMDAIGISMTGQVPKQLKPEMVERATHIVAMGYGVDGERGAAKFVPQENWAIDDPAGRAFGEVCRIRDEIRARVDAMVAGLK